MNTRLPTVAAALLIVGLFGWLAYRTPTGAPAGSGPDAQAPRSETTVLFQERSAGSEVPCAVPLAWRVARVDPEFAMTREEASAIIEEATGLWEDATGRALFTRDPDAGFPIRLVYDDRQERAAERAQQQQVLDDVRADIEVRRAELVDRQERYRTAVEDLQVGAQDLDRRIGAHNAAIQEWNDAGDGPEERWTELEAEGAELQRERDALEARRRRLDEDQTSLRAAEADLDGRIVRHQRLADELESALPPEEVEAGVYREAVSRRGAELVEVSREIRLYRFTDADELRLLAAHEMGHALGLGHLDDPSAVMSPLARDGALPSEPSRSDIELFQRTCPPGRAR